MEINKLTIQIASELQISADQAESMIQTFCKNTGSSLETVAAVVKYVQVFKEFPNSLEQLVMRPHPRAIAA